MEALHLIPVRIVRCFQKFENFILIRDNVRRKTIFTIPFVEEQNSKFLSSERRRSGNNADVRSEVIGDSEYSVVALV